MLRRSNATTLECGDHDLCTRSTDRSQLRSGHGPSIDFLGSGGAPGIRLTTATGAWTAIAPGPDLEQGSSVRIWARGVIVTGDRDGLVVYRPV